MNLKFTKLNRVNILLVVFLAFILHNEAQSQNNPQITCPGKSVLNICAPVGIPATYALEDFNPSDDNTPTAEIGFDIKQTVDTYTDFTVVTHLYTFTDRDGNSNTCEMVYNVLNRYLQAPELQEQRPICQGDFFTGVKFGSGNYRIYADDNGSHGELLGLCDSPGALCAAEKLGIDGLTAATNKLWISHFVTFPDGSICESTLSPLQIDVLEKPEASLTTSAFTAFTGDIITLMDLVEENETGYWSGSNISSFATADGKTDWVFSAAETGLIKLFYTVTNGPCVQSYTLIVDVKDTLPPVEPEPAEGPSGATGPDGPVGPGGGGVAPVGPTGPGGSSDWGFDTTGASPPSSGGGSGGGVPVPGPQPDAGLVTAGEWNDLNNWEFLDSIFNENIYYEMPEYWDFYPQNRVAVLVKSTDSLPIIDATVELSYEGEVNWIAKTDNKGKAELWPSLYNNDTIDVSNLSLIVNDEPIAGAVLLYQEGINEVTLRSRPDDLKNVEISFIVDATGSMADELEFLKQDLRDVITTVEDTTSNLDISTATVFYRDEGDEYLVRQSDFTTDIDETIAFIQGQYAGGGGDFPEAVHTALDAGVNNLQWSANAKARIAFLLLDAPPHYRDDVISDIQNSIQTAAAKGIKIIPITASGIDKQTEFLMRFMAMATNGTYTFITNDSGIGGDHIDPSIGDFDVEYLNNLLVRLILEYTN